MLEKKLLSFYLIHFHEFIRQNEVFAKHIYNHADHIIFLAKKKIVVVSKLTLSYTS